MRNVLTSADAIAQAAGAEVLASGGGSADAVVAAMLAGATRGSAASLLGSGVVLIAGAGVGAFIVDGRARAPGRSARRPTAPENPPRAWQAAVPGLLEGALTAHNRFGVLPLANVVRAALNVLRESDPSADVRARMTVLEALPRDALTAIDRLGIRQAIVEAAGAAAGGVFTREDLSTFHPPVISLRAVSAGEHEILLAPEDPPVRFPPPAIAPSPSGAAVCADKNGVMACALWSIADEAIALGVASGLSLGALSNAPTKGVSRRRPGTPVFMPMPAAMLRTEGRVWSAIVVSGEGDLDALCDRAVGARLATARIEYAGSKRTAEHARGVVSWVIRDPGGDIRAASDAHG